MLPDPFEDLDDETLDNCLEELCSTDSLEHLEAELKAGYKCTKVQAVYWLKEKYMKTTSYGEDLYRLLTCETNSAGSSRKAKTGSANELEAVDAGAEEYFDRRAWRKRKRGESSSGDTCRDGRGSAESCVLSDEDGGAVLGGLAAEEVAAAVSQASLPDPDDFETVESQEAAVLSQESAAVAHAAGTVLSPEDVMDAATEAHLHSYSQLDSQ